MYDSASFPNLFNTSWLCLSFAVAVSQIPHSPKSLYAMVMFACSEIGRSTKPRNPRASNSKDGVMQVRTIYVLPILFDFVHVTWLESGSIYVTVDLLDVALSIWITVAHKFNLFMVVILKHLVLLPCKEEPIWYVRL
ncbi:hypothetical protein VNO80_30262 [Phaseolus coccineus]|uniref:Uncharacterized protein n=1 Tax=Phaseolus coccineus TaxID=3886 RepID=A0AAN9LHI6_PHACN